MGGPAHRAGFARPFLVLCPAILVVAGSPACPAAEAPVEAVALGVIGKAIVGEAGCPRVDAGQAGIPLFATPAGALIARLQLRAEPSEGCRAYLLRGSEGTPLLGTQGITEISYESGALAYYEVRGGFARVLAEAFAPGYWIRIKDLPDGKVHRWAELLVADPHFGYTGHDGLTLHAAPSEESAAVVRLHEGLDAAGRSHQLVATGELSGNWGRFEVSEFDGDSSSMAEEPGKPTGRRWTGWLRLVQANGARRIWMYTRD